MNTLKSTRHLFIGVLLVCLLLISFPACSADGSSIDSSTAMQFLDYIIADDYDAAYAMLAEDITDIQFRPVWEDLRSITASATSYEKNQAGFHVNLSNGVTTTTQSYMIKLDNGKTFTYRIALRGNPPAVIGLHYRDVTRLLADARSVQPVVNGILWIVSIAFLAFRIWMLVDCLRRKIRHKPLWIFLILLSLTLTLTLGDRFGLRFGVACILDRLTWTADPWAYAWVLSMSLPVGALAYLIARKKLIIDPPTPPAPADDSPEGQAESKEA